MLIQKFKENDKTFKFAKRFSTETSVIFSYLMYKAFEVDTLGKNHGYSICIGHCIYSKKIKLRKARDCITELGSK